MNKKISETLRFRKRKNEKSPVWFIDIRGTDFSPTSPRWQKEINSRIKTVLKGLEIPEQKEPVLIKCHIGERKCRTRMLPEFCISTVEHFRSKGLKRIVCGDSTVAYSGDRGYHDNHGDCRRYIALAEKHRWSKEGPLKTPFVVLDRPQTSVKRVFSFSREEVVLGAGASKRFKEVYLSSGFAAAGTIVNHVHLTLHDMAQIASAVKGITMGGSSYRGKLIMHKCYSPVIDEEGCKKCGTCFRKCPENAIEWEKGQTPKLTADRCIGCGECVAVCHGRSISMTSSEIEDWLKGGESLPYRMADYMMGMMQGRWNRLLNIAHLYNITRKCDCVDKVQKPILPHIGFLIGPNPFAVDLMSTYLVHEEFYKLVKNGTVVTRKPLKKSKVLQYFFDGYHGIEPYRHIQKEYGIVVEPDPVRIKLT